MRKQKAMMMRGMPLAKAAYFKKSLLDRLLEEEKKQLYIFMQSSKRVPKLTRSPCKTNSNFLKVMYL
jgi:hypothetical protein